MCFLSFICHSFGALYHFWDRPGQRAKGKLATCRHRADSEREMGHLYFAMIYISRMRTMTKQKAVVEKVQQVNPGLSRHHRGRKESSGLGRV